MAKKGTKVLKKGTVNSGNLTVNAMVKMDELYEKTVKKKMEKIPVANYAGNNKTARYLINNMESFKVDGDHIVYKEKGKGMWCIIKVDGRWTWKKDPYTNGKLNLKQMNFKAHYNNGRLRLNINNISVSLERFILLAESIESGYVYNISNYDVNVKDLTGNSSTCFKYSTREKAWEHNFNPDNLEWCNSELNKKHEIMYERLVKMFANNPDIYKKFPLSISAYWTYFNKLVNQGNVQMVEDYLRIKGLI